jgi:hypothetical protein
MLRTTRLTVRHRMAVATAGLLIAMTAACSKDATAPVDTFSGSYSLAAVDGDDPPVTIYDGNIRASDGSAIPAKIAVTDGTLDLDGDQYALTIKIRITAQGQAVTQTVKDEGSFTRNGTQIVFESDGDDFGTFKGTLSGGKLKLKLDLIGSGDALEYAYVK